MESEPADKKKEELMLELSRAMGELRNFMRRYIQEKLREQGTDLTFEMLEVMGRLWKKDGINQQDIADQTMRDKSSMTYLLDNLVKRKLVKRIEDHIDRRNKLIYLTEAGIKLKEQLNPWVAEVYRKATTDVAEADIKHSIELLSAMISNMKGL
jgi:DNA-binding MarR family transcriptional regulator